MKLDNKFLFGISLVLILLIGIGSAYMGSDPKLIEGRSQSMFQVDELASFNQDMCQEGTDFVVQIPPLGCTPIVVRSDLLEEQNVPVFCELSAIKINPLINIKAIDSISFSGGDYPPAVQTIGFHPSYSALGENRQLNNLMWDNIGYAVISLKQMQESELTNCKKEGLSEVCRIKGNLTARIRYDLEGAFGLRRHLFYLPAMTDSEFSSKYGQYAFFDKKGFLRAENVDTDSASIVIYSGRNENLFGQSKPGVNDKQKVAQINLDVGETSGEMFLPGFDCLATVKFRLDAVESPDTLAKLSVNSEATDVKKGETFLENKCNVIELEKRGLNQKVRIKCLTDEGPDTFNLRITPSVSLEIGGSKVTKKVGEYLYSAEDKHLYLAYVGTKEETGKKEDLIVYIVAIPKRIDSEDPDEDVLPETELKTAAFLVNALEIGEGNAKDYAQQVSGLSMNFYRWLINGDNFKFLSYGEEEEIFKKNLKILDFGTELNFPLGTETSNNYLEALEDYDLVLSNFVGEKYGDGTPEADLNLGERALYAKIILADSIQQKHDVRLFCNEFMESYSESELDVSLCLNLKEMSNTEVSTKYVLIDGDWQRISFERIVEPSFEDYGIKISVRVEDGEPETYQMEKDQTIYLNSVVDEDNIFEVKASLFTISFKHNFSGWFWSADKNNWMSTSNLIVKGGDFDGKKPSSMNLDLIKSLDGVPFNVGSKTLLRRQGKLDYIKLVEVHEDKAILDIKIYNRSNLKVFNDFTGSSAEIINKNSPVSFGGDYTFILKETHAEQLAKVSVIPDINHAGSDVDFSFNVGVEKRAIQLSPEKTQNRVEKLNKTIAEWKKRSESLGDVVETMKKACLGLGAALTVKNVIGGAGGKTIARESVMYGANGWYEKCGGKEYDGTTYSSEEECLFKNANLIDAEVNQITSGLTAQNTNIKKIQKKYTTEKILSQSIVNTAEFIAEYSEQANDSLDWIGQHGGFLEVEAKLKNVQPALDEDNWKAGVYSIDQLKEIELYSNLLKDNPGNEDYEARLLKALTDVEVNSEKKILMKKLERSVFQSGLTKSIPRIYAGTNSREETYDGDLVPATGFAGLPVGKPVQTIVYESVPYNVVLNVTAENKYFIYEIYYLNNTIVEKNKNDEIRSKYSSFVKYDSKSYDNPYRLGQKPKLTYYETDPYKGLPAMIPFDAVHGWYAFVKQTIPTGRKIRTYDDSGAINSFWLCNVGQNGLAEFQNDLGDDICRQINMGIGEPYSDYPGLKSSEASKLVKKAKNAIEQASRAYGDGVKKVYIFDKLYEVGSPAMNIPGIRCTDYMSPKDCKLLFNVCDPVICPNSRCDFGGSYPVPDVIQSGIIGSIALCLPNFNEGIYVPVCLTGVKAGIDGYLSIAQAYQDCLAHNLATGETIGVCDEIHSIYLCEFFWRQAFPLAKLAIPKLLGILTGQNSRGGGEYMGIQAAWQNAKDSIDYFTQFYAINSFNAFKARSTEEVGTAACGSFVSVAYPNGQGILDVLTESDSPPQFNAKFDTIPFTTTTFPPVNQYKVFYHIYAGNDRGAYFKVYLKGETQGSYFQGSGFGKSVDSGYIPKGEYKSETIDFTAAEGYDELCVVVNEQEECGFAQVTSNFALDYIKDQYIKNQATADDIKSEEECISGSPNIYSLSNPNLGEGFDSLIDPAIYQKGLIRICSTDDPGKGSDPNAGIEGARWLDVGHCGNEKIRCWIDKESIKDAVEFEKTYNDSLDDLTKHYTEDFIEDKGYLNTDNFKLFLNNLSIEEDGKKKIDLIEDVFDKIFFNNQKGYLYYLLGGIYGQFTRTSFERDEQPKIDALQARATGEEVVLSGTCIDRDNVLERIVFLDGKPREGNLIDVDGNGESCFDAAFTPHALVQSQYGGSVYYYKYCFWSLGQGSFEVIDSSGHTSVLNDFGISDNIKYSCTALGSSGCEKTGEISENEKLGSLQPGDVISYASQYQNYLPHNAVFMGWVDEAGKIANLFDWSGEGDTFGFSDVNISDSSYPVYQIWKIYCDEAEVGIDFTAAIVPEDIYFIESTESPKLQLDDLCYKYFDGEWYWTTDCVYVGGERAVAAMEGSYTEKIDWLKTDTTSSPYSNGQLGDEDKEVILELNDFVGNLEGGLLYLVEELENRGSGSYLKTSWVSLSSQKIFNLESEGVDLVGRESHAFDESINFVNLNGEWFWSIDEEDYDDGKIDSWVKSPEISKDIEKYLNNLEETFIGSLNGVSFKEGLKLLLWFDLEEYKRGGFLSGDDDLTRKKWGFEESLCSVQNLNGRYSDNPENQEFVNEICADKLLTEEQCKDVKGEGGWIFNREDSMEFVENVLVANSYSTKKTWTYLSAFLKLRSMRKIRYLDEPRIINQWYSEGLINEATYQFILDNKREDVYLNLINQFIGEINCEFILNMEEILTIDDALIIVSRLEGMYSDNEENKFFVERVYSLGFLSYEYYGKLLKKGPLGWATGFLNMADLRIYLFDFKEDLGRGRIWTPKNALRELQNLGELYYDEDSLFINELYLDGLISLEEFSDFQKESQSGTFVNIYDSVRTILLKKIPAVGDLEELPGPDNRDVYKKELAFFKLFLKESSLDIGAYNTLEILDIENNHIVAIDMEGGGIESLKYLDKLEYLETLFLPDNSVTDLSVLSNLNNLRELYLFSNEISDVSPLSNLDNLKYLNLDDNFIENLSSLENLFQLIMLSVENNCFSANYDFSYFSEKLGFDFYAGSNPRDDC